MTGDFCTAEYLEKLAGTSSPWYMTLLGVHIVCCIAAITLTVLSAAKCEESSISSNLKVLLWYHRVADIVYCVSFVAIELYHFISRFIYTDCDLLVPARICIFFRVLQSYSIVQFQLFFIAVLFDTYCNLFVHCYRCHPHSATIVGWTLVLFSLISVAPSIPKDFASSAYLVNCASLENKSKQVQRYIFIWLFALDIISGVLFVFLSYWAAKTRADPVHKFSVNNRYLFRNLKTTLQMMFPNLALNLGCYVYYGAMSLEQTTEDHVTAVRFLESYSVPFYVLMSPIFWNYTAHRNRRISVVRPWPPFDEYHAGLSTWWSNETFAECTFWKNCKRKPNKVKPERKPSTSNSAIELSHINIAITNASKEIEVSSSHR